MSDNFAKLFEVEGRQVLIEAHVDPEDDTKTSVTQTTVIDGVRVAVTGSGVDRDACDIIAEMDEKYARDFYALALSAVKATS